MAFITSPNMNLTIPGVGTESGPQYALDINNSLNRIDSHNHTTGNGVSIPTSGLNINAPLSMNGNNLTNINFLQLSLSSNIPVVSSSTMSIYTSSVGDLWITNPSGQVRITNGLNLAISGAIGFSGLPSGTASASYSGGTFIFQSATDTSANIDGGSFILRNNIVASNGLTLQPPNAMPLSYSITLPSLPSSSQTNPAPAPVLMDTVGNMSTGNSFDYILPSGILMPFAGNSIPNGWLLCNGQAVSRSTYAALFTAIGVIYGSGDGINTFNVPNMQGNVPVGVGGTIGASLGGTGGEATHTLTVPEMPSHTHVQNAHSHSVNSVTDTNSVPISKFARGNTDNPNSGGLSTNSTTAINQNTGGGGPHNNVQPYLAVNYIIKT